MASPNHNSSRLTGKTGKTKKTWHTFKNTKGSFTYELPVQPRRLAKGDLRLGVFGTDAKQQRRDASF